jgi:hypothetical protein
MALQVPSHYIPNLNSIRTLSGPATEELVTALSSAKITASSDEMRDRIAAQVSLIPKDELGQITDVLYAMYHVREFSELNRNSFLKELVESVREHADPPISDEELPTIRQRFKELLNIPTLETISKAITLQREDERIFCDARIISDIRPIFAEDVKSRPEAATIGHSLRIAYHEGMDHKEFFVSLDEYDLNELEEIVKRAKDKSDALTKFLSDSGIPRLGI